MNSRVERSLDRLTDEARDRYSALVDNARSRTERAAGQVRKGKQPLKTLSRLGVNLTSVSHKTTAKVLKQQTKMVENQIDALASRLRVAASADSVSELIRGQMRMIPEQASQFVADNRAALSIVTGAGGEVRQLMGGTLSELRRGPRTTTTTTKKKAKRAARTAKTKAKSAAKTTKARARKAA